MANNSRMQVPIAFDPAGNAQRALGALSADAARCLPDQGLLRRRHGAWYLLRHRHLEAARLLLLAWPDVAA